MHLTIQTDAVLASVEGVSAHTNSIFQQPFWLDAVAPNRWSAIEIKSGDEVQARWPYVVSRNRLGMTILTMPQLTQALGPWLAEYPSTYPKGLARQKELMTALIDRLPPHDLFSQSFHYSITNWLPFHWKGFSQTTRYTYVIEDLRDPDLVWSGLEADVRRDVRRAKQQLDVRADPDVERFLDLNEMTFARQDRPLPYGRDLVRRLDDACARRGMRRMFFAEDARGRLHGALYLVWDERSAYYLMGGGDPELRSSGAASLLLWEAIQFAATVTRKFDFEGSMIESIERFFRAFGARQNPYFQIARMSSRMRVVRGLSAGLKSIRESLAGHNQSNA